MIAKQVALRSAKRSDFAALVKYLTDEQSKDERVGYVTATNCQSDNVDLAVIDILNTQGKNVRAKGDKTYHLIVSFRPGEEVADDVLKAIEKRICDGLGFGEHQRISAVHHDTDNLHIHIAINKIHPTRHTIREPFNDHFTLSGLCGAIEAEFGLQVDNHRAQKTQSESRAQDMERHAGVESLVGWAKRECAEQLQSATTWEDFHRVLREHSLSIAARGNGFVIESNDGTVVKASSISRELSKGRLEQRLGSFEPPVDATPGDQARPAKGYEAAPKASRMNTGALYAAFKVAREYAIKAKAEGRQGLTASKNRQIESAKRAAKAKRAAIALMVAPGLSKRLLYSAVSKTLHAEIESIKKATHRDRAELEKRYQPRSWADWLRAEASTGSQEALQALRAREASTGLQGNTVTGTGARADVPTTPDQDSVTKKGTVIYRAGETALRDDGEKLAVSRGATPAGLDAALRLAAQRYGNRLRVSGTDAFKEQIAQCAAIGGLPITFEDPRLERRRQELANLAKETRNDPTIGRRIDRAGIGSTGHTVARDNNSRRPISGGLGHRGRRPVWSGAQLPKPHVAGVGRRPPPEAIHRLRDLQKLGVVQLARGGEGLLPGHVSRHMEQPGTQPNHQLRRQATGAGAVTNAGAVIDPAAEYVREREGKRLSGINISKHVRYTDDLHGDFEYAGTRIVEGKPLVLLKRGEVVHVREVDEQLAGRLSRKAIGSALRISSRGEVRAKGRGR